MTLRSEFRKSHSNSSCDLMNFRKGFSASKSSSTTTLSSQDMEYDRSGSRRSVWSLVAAAVLLLAGVACSVVVLRWLQTEDSQRREASLRRWADDLAGLGAANMRLAANELYATYSMVEVWGPDAEVLRGDMTFSQFMQFHDSRKQVYPDFFNCVLYAPIVKDSDRAAYELVGQTVYQNPTYLFREATSSPNFGQPREVAPEYVPALYRWPLKPELQGIDFLQGPPVIREVLLASLETGRPALSSLLKLDEDERFATAGSSAMFMSLPVMGSSGAVASFILGIINTDKLMATLPQTTVNARCFVVDEEVADEVDSVVFAMGVEGDGMLTRSQLLEEVAASPSMFANTIDFEGHAFTIISDFGPDTSSSSLKNWIVFSVMLLLTVCAFFLLLLKEKELRNALALKKRRMDALRMLDRTRAANALLSSISHDIRTPMNGILGAITLMDETTDLDDQQKEYVSICKSCSEILLHLVEDFLDFKKIEAGALRLNPVLCTVDGILGDVLSIYQVKSVESGVSITTFVSADVPRGSFYADEWRVKQVILNLVSNSFKFTRRGGSITISVCAGSDAERKLGPSQAYLQISVVDTGCGIRNEDLDGVFSPFIQAKAPAGVTASVKPGGVGLGLAICSELVGLMGGKISCTSELGVGTCFMFTVVTRSLPSGKECLTASSDDEEFDVPPGRSLMGSGNRSVATVGTAVTDACSDSAESSLATVGTAPQLLQPSEVHGMSVLLVDDSTVNLKVMGRMLEKQGCTVATASNGQEAVTAVKAALGSLPFDVVLMDIQMPIMGGLDATRLIREMEGNSDAGTRCIISAVTASIITASEFNEWKKLGFDDFLIKPIQSDDLARKLRKWMRIVNPSNDPSSSSSPLS
jgi:signal transduction histidine kinase/ActR/RegA family two-component response regulator